MAYFPLGMRTVRSTSEELGLVTSVEKERGIQGVRLINSVNEMG